MSISNQLDGTLEKLSVQYRAPALEKGLDILELLVTEDRPLAMGEICKKLRRSQGEIFRMVQVLQFRGYLEQEEGSDGYHLTDKIFTMAMRQPPTQGMIESALPTMRQLATETGQSCHLAMHARGEIVVVARMESYEQIGFSVRVGYRQSILATVSGVTLYAFQPSDVQERWLSLFSNSADAAEIADFCQRSERARSEGFARAASSFVNGVTDISAPIIRGERAAGALTVPFMEHKNHPMTADEVTKSVVVAAAHISRQLVRNDSRA